MQGIFVGTFLIGLREGLEATLIVSIVGAFLKRNDKPVRPMFIGVGLAVVISIVVGVGLEIVSASLPQRQQEMLETVIGAIAVVFVTTMIIWMNRNAFRMKGELEREAAQAINSGGTLALAVMAFLAVLKEGFETAVFLLAAAQATHGSRWFAVLGGVAGIAAAIVIGAGLYFGSLRLNLGRFFRITGVFLVFIAAGLVMSSLRTAHEAGWITIGQQRALDLSPWISDEIRFRRADYGHVRNSARSPPDRGTRMAPLCGAGAAGISVAHPARPEAGGETPNPGMRRCGTRGDRGGHGRVHSGGRRWFAGAGQSGHDRGRPGDDRHGRHRWGVARPAHPHPRRQ